MNKKIACCGLDCANCEDMPICGACPEIDIYPTIDAVLASHENARSTLKGHII